MAKALVYDPEMSRVLRDMLVELSDHVVVEEAVEYLAEYLGAKLVTKPTEFTAAPVTVRTPVFVGGRFVGYTDTVVSYDVSACKRFILENGSGEVHVTIEYYPGFEIRVAAYKAEEEFEDEEEIELDIEDEDIEEWEKLLDELEEVE